MRPRSETSMPWDLAHSRTSLVLDDDEEEPYADEYDDEDDRRARPRR